MKRTPQPIVERLAALRVRAEARISRSPSGVPAEAGTGGLAHELLVHRIELELQNDELRRTQAALEVVRDRYLDLYDFAPVGYFTLSADGVIAEANLTGAQMLGHERAGLLGQPFARHVAPADGDRWHRHLQRLVRAGGPGRIELQLRGRGDQVMQALIDSARVQPAGAKPSVRITLTDIGERKRVEAALGLADAAFETQEGKIVVDDKGVIERVNKAFTRITGFSADEAVGRHVRLLRSGRHDAAFYAEMWACIRRAGTWQGEVWNRRRCGEVYPQWLKISAVAGEDGTATRFLGTMVDISQRGAQGEEFAQMAFFDPLTGLPNRRLLKDRLNQALAASARSGRTGALMFIDLDHFKKVNDSVGHDQGDLLLKQVAQRLTSGVREGDTVARLGGDEFVVMLGADFSDALDTAAAQAKTIGEKMLAALGRPYDIAGTAIQVGASIGVTLFSGRQASADDLLKRADQAMYQAKAAGRDRLRFFDSGLQHVLQRRSTLEAELLDALLREEFVLHYQPHFDRRRRLLGAEALVRWQHPLRGLLPPGEFITVAEDSGLIVSLGHWVLAAACAQLAAWSADPNRRHLLLSVNVSARQLRDRCFVEQVLDLLDRSRADPTRLELELTESTMLDNVDDTIAKMNALRAHGVGFSLDDFGTGYASLTYLKRLPLDRVKIDRSFIADMATHPRDAAVVRAIIDLGRHLDLMVIAEGVETEAQRDMLVQFGCHVFQGNLFGRATALQATSQAAPRSVAAGARNAARRCPGAAPRPKPAR